ncbi:rhomboid family intramembrane serine protease [Candidatus Pacearchaeota archaeon]|nr:rhomboid family intramembrane serine protease [Candidatus Pacearchaeota archaeon]
MKKYELFSTYAGKLIVINVIAFFAFMIFVGIVGGEKAISWVALMPAAIFSGKSVWTFITSMFMHGSFTHLLVNMISLSFIGSFVEKLIGKKRFLRVYLIGGLFAGLLFVTLAGLFGNTLLGERIVGSPFAYAVGASGAIFALGGLLAVLTPKLPVMVFFIIPMPMWIAMAVLMFGLWAVSLGAGLGIGNTAHLGGLIIGLGYGFYLKKKYPHKTKMISRYFTK